MTTLLRNLPFGAKGVDMLLGIMPALRSRYLFFYAHFKQALFQAMRRHTHKTTLKIEVHRHYFRQQASRADGCL